MNKHLLFPILVFSILLSLSVAKPVLADVPKIIDVIPWNNGSDVMLNVTIYHDVGGEVTGHYVDNIEVNIGGNNQNFAQSGPHTYYDTINHYFNVTVGPITGITGTPTVTVRAHDNVHGWSETNWTGQIPEFSRLILLLTLILATSIPISVLRKAKTRVHR